MLYQKFQPAACLQPFVECYFTWNSAGPLEKELVIESPPNGFCSIVFNDGDPYTLRNKKYEHLEVPRRFISGQSIYSYTLFLKGKIDIAGIVFKPAALATLFNLEAYELTEQRKALLEMLPHEHVQEFAKLVDEATEPLEKVKQLEAFLLHHIQLFPPEPDYIDIAANTVIERNGMLHVYDLLKESCMSRRTFERRFFRKVGLSPKYYARIRRISYICNLVAGKKKVNWPDVFYEAEFYDQAHFIKDFEEFTGRTPQQYLRENSELANFVSKPSVQRF